VIWYCGESSYLLAVIPGDELNGIFLAGSSAGRGTRAAGWFADYLKEKNDTEIKSLVLAGGIKGWAAAGTEYTALMDGYDASVWTK
jgi:arsenical-resistance protein 2